MRECAVFPAEYSSKCKSIGSWSSLASTAGAVRDVGSCGKAELIFAIVPKALLWKSGKLAFSVVG